MADLEIDTLLPPDQVLRKKLIAAAIRAPSGDNCQPWHFRFDGNRIAIDVLPERAKSFFDFERHGTFLSLGAVSENIRVQARSVGLGVTSRYCAGETHAARQRVELVLHHASAPAQASDHEQLDALHSRTVNRRPFLPLRVAAEKQRAWLANRVEGTTVTIIEDRGEMARCAQVAALADRIRWTHPQIHKELFSKILFSRDEAETKRIGLEIDRLGAGPLAVPLMRWLQPWERMARLQNYGVAAMLAMQARSLAWCAGALVLITIDKDTPELWMRAGEQMQRLWILNHQQGLCVQPLPVALYLDQRFCTEGMANFLPAHRAPLEAIRGALAGLLGNRVGAMLYRVGRGWKMSHPAVRLPIETFYEDSSSAADTGDQ